MKMFMKIEGMSSAFPNRSNATPDEFLSGLHREMKYEVGALATDSKCDLDFLHVELPTEQQGKFTVPLVVLRVDFFQCMCIEHWDEFRARQGELEQVILRVFMGRLESNSMSFMSHNHAVLSFHNK